MSNRRVAACLPLLFATLLLIQSAHAQGRSNVQFGKTPSANSPFTGSVFDSTSNNGRINGTVHTFDGHPVSNASVSAHDVAHGTVSVSVRTEPNGTFVFQAFPLAAMK